MKLWIVIKEIFLSIIGNALYFISLFVPKNKKLWIFGGLLGKDYNDNGKYFFEYINDTKKHINAVWITQNSDVVHTLRKKGYTAYLGYSIRGCWILMCAGVAVISHSRVRDLKPFVITPKVKFIQLWHGIPLKKIELDDKVFFNKASLIRRLGFLVMGIISPACRRKFDMFIACSKEDQKNFSSAFNLEIEKIKITGYPRNDQLINDRLINAKKNIEPSEKPLNVLYVPTFRGVEKSNFDLFEKYKFNFNRMDRFLKNRKMILFIKLHPYNRPSSEFLQNLEHSENIRYYEDIDIYGTLSLFDILITDFSSIYFDYLLLNKPIIFAPFGMTDYIKNDRELYYPYNEATPGPKATNWEDVEQYLTLFSENSKAYGNERQDIKNKFHKYKDSNSSERIYQQILQLF